ncbi:tape measure protein [Arthrobacter sp. IA7]|nr:tape measure protein [Arthrobacter ipis]
MSGVMGGLIKGGLAGAAVGAAAAVFSPFVEEAASASDAADKFKASLSFAGLSTKEIDAATKAAKGYADQTVYDLPTIQNMMAQLASNGVKNYTGLTTAAGNLNAVAGGNADTFKSVAMVMTQTAGAGKLTTENWNQLADAIPGGAGQLQKALQASGAYTGNFRDAMSKGEITAQEFNASLLKLGSSPVAVEAAQSTKTFEGALGNLNATINSGLMVVLDAMKPAITGAVNGLSTGIGMIGPLISSMQPILQRFGAGFVGVWSAIQPLVNALITTLTPVVRGLMPVFSTVFKTVVSVVTGAMGIMKSIIQTVTALIKGDWNGVWNGIKNILQGVWGVIKSIVSGAITVVKLNIQNVTGVIKGIWEGIWNGMKGHLDSAWSGIKTGVSNGIGGMMGFIRDIPGKVTGALAGAGGWLVGIGKNIIQGLIDGIGSMMGSIGRAILNIVPAAIRGPFEQALGIHSPSRVFKGYGVNIGEGLILGVDKMEGKIKNSMENMVSLPSVKPPKAFPDLAAFGGNAGSSASGPLGAGTNINFSMPALDPEGYASAVARRMNSMVV